MAVQLPRHYCIVRSMRGTGQSHQHHGCHVSNNQVPQRMTMRQSLMITCTRTVCALNRVQYIMSLAIDTLMIIVTIL